MATLIVRKVANALIAGVELSATARQTAGWLAPAMMREAALFGGLWVGGELKLFDDHLHFEPNALNRLVNSGDLTIDVPLTSINAVSWRRGLVTSIVDVTYDNRRVSFRCFGSKDLARAVQQAVNVARRLPLGDPTG
jgi:hypothetical protein